MATPIASPAIPLVLDTDVFTDWSQQRPHTVNFIRAYLSQNKFPPKLAAVTVFETHRGFEKLIVKSGSLDQPTQRLRSRVEQLIQDYGVLAFDQRAAEIAAYVYARLSRSTQNRQWRDVFIAATALAHGHGVATRNQSDFDLIGQHLPPQSPTLHLAIWKP